MSTDPSNTEALLVSFSIGYEFLRSGSFYPYGYRLKSNKSYLRLVRGGVKLSEASQCQSNAMTSTHSDQYLDNKDGTVTDTLTGLMWKQCPEAYNWSEKAPRCIPSDGNEIFTWRESLIFTWQESLQTAKVSQFGYNDWRVPNIKELTSILEYTCGNPAIHLKIFPNVPKANLVDGSGTILPEVYLPFHSSTPFLGDRTWIVNFSTGDIFDRFSNVPSLVRMVRNTN